MILMLAILLFLNGVFYNDSLSFIAAGLFYIAYAEDLKNTSRK